MHTVIEAPPRPRTDTPVLSIRGVSKRFGAVQALHDVDFEVHAGEVVALVADNGAGKSTLVKIIAGIHQPDEGEFYFDGEPVELDSPRDAAELGIATVYQDLAMCDNLDAVANLFLGRELVAAGLLSLTGQLDEIATELRSHELLEQLSVTIPSVRSEVGTLSGASASRSQSPARSSASRSWYCSTSRPPPSASRRRARFWR